MKSRFRMSAIAWLSNDSCAMTWHQWQVEYPIERKIGRSALAPVEGLLTPGMPVDRVVGVLEQIWAALGSQPVRHLVLGTSRPECLGASCCRTP